MKRFCCIILLSLSVVCYGKNNVQKYIDRQLINVPEIQNGIVAIYAEDASGRQIAALNPDMPLHTASILKTITTGLAYQILGEDFRFSTRVAYSGNILEDGTLDGDIYILGGGDPTIGSVKDISCPSDSVFNIWMAGIEKAGIKCVNGRIIGDDRIFSEESAPNVWSYGNISSTSGCGTCGLPFAINRSEYYIVPGENPGDPVSISPLTNAVPDLQIVNDAVTGKKGSGKKNIAYHNVPYSNSIRFYGTYPVGLKGRTVTTSNQYGAWTCAYEFHKYLAGRGIPVSGYDCTANVRRNGEKIPAQESLPVIAVTESPALKDIVFVTNKVSQNFMAETLFKMVGKRLIEDEKGEPALNVSYKKTRKAVSDFMEGQGIDLTGYKQYDGSGLSRKNCLSPRFFARFYSYMLSCPQFGSYLASFPQPGGYGTLEDVLKDADDSLKAIIHAKSGSLDDVRSYAGYVESSKGCIRFAIIVNNISCPIKTIQPYVEKFLEELAIYASRR